MLAGAERQHFLVADDTRKRPAQKTRVAFDAHDAVRLAGCRDRLGGQSGVSAEIDRVPNLPFDHRKPIGQIVGEPRKQEIGAGRGTRRAPARGGRR